MKNTKVEVSATEELNRSDFTGGAIINGLMNLAVLFGSLCTLFIAYPFLVCWKYKWVNAHTYINGRRLTFDGNGFQLLGKFILWLFLSLITLGIYFVVRGKLNLVAWKTKHTHFEGTEVCGESKSRFTGKWFQLCGVNFVSKLVILITLSVGIYWAHCYKERWYAKHTIIDGQRLYFDGKAIEYFGKVIVWSLLTIITCGIYGFWLTVKSLKWNTKHTFAEKAETLQVPQNSTAVIKNSETKISSGVQKRKTNKKVKISPYASTYTKIFCSDCNKEITSCKCLGCGKPLKIKMGIFTIWGAHMKDFPGKEQN